MSMEKGLPAQRTVSVKPGDKVRMSVTQDNDGNCTVIEHDLAASEEEQKQGRIVATFHADVRMKPVVGKHGPDLAAIDAARIRAITFAQLFERLVNGGTVELG